MVAPSSPESIEYRPGAARGTSGPESRHLEGGYALW
jgi:hypothetical protein